jgi:hypothetical protein
MGYQLSAFGRVKGDGQWGELAAILDTPEVQEVQEVRPLTISRTHRVTDSPTYRLTDWLFHDSRLTTDDSSRRLAVWPSRSEVLAEPLHNPAHAVDAAVRTPDPGEEMRFAGVAHHLRSHPARAEDGEEDL